MTRLPINAVLPEIKLKLLESNNVVLIAPPGAGKTTGVPLALLNEDWLGQRKIIMLEPRRLAAKNAATWMAHQLGESVGNTVGYRMRLDTKVSQKTKIEVVTEGILTRIIQNDIALDDYALVIFDEFHERSLNADLGLALTLDIQQQLRPSLRMLVMSATLEGQVVSRILGDAPVITSEGRSYPVKICYSTNTGFQHVENYVVNCILKALSTDKGSILVFLPGASEIRRVYDRLQSKLDQADISVYPLYSNLSQNDQETAIAPCIKGERKVVLATSIAETSLTIDGVCIVIDAGLVRQPNYDPRSGLSLLETVKVSKASADQRAGRAGRTEPGMCYRLWTASEHAGLITQNQVEINQADLSAFSLDLARWGALQKNELSWIDPPPTSALNQSRTLLESLGAIDKFANVTEHGVTLSTMGLHPRLSHMVLKAISLGVGEIACDIAAILNERDYFQYVHGEFNCDLVPRVQQLRISKAHNQRIDPIAKQRIFKNANDLLRQHKLTGKSKDQMAFVGIVLAFAYPDRVAMQRKGSLGRFQLSNGIGAQVSAEDSLSNTDFLVVANLRSFQGSNQFNEARVFLAAKITKDQIEEYLDDLIIDIESTQWDKTSRSVKSLCLHRLGKLVLSSQISKNPDTEKIKTALIQGIRELGIDSLPWTKQDKDWQQRVLFLRYARPKEDWPDVSNEALLKNLTIWLLPFLDGLSRLEHLKKLNVGNMLSCMLDWKAQKLMDDYAPISFKVPSGSQVSIDYQDCESPVLAVRIQELFGLETTPKINGGQTNLVLHLLSPPRRPIQVTQDLSSFWDNTYMEVKKDLKGRYPKHYWPDDPRKAVATKRLKKYM